MMDKSLSIWLTVLFGISGTTVLLLAWLWPTLGLDKITATLAGAVGLTISVAGLRMLKRTAARTPDRPVPVKVEAECKP